VGSDRVVVVAPGLEVLASLGERAEQGLVEEFVSEPSVEALHEAFCTGLPGAM
jgi:hypothetical protein